MIRTAFAQEVPIPNWRDPRARPEKVEPPGAQVVRFLTDDAFPPFHFADPDDVPTGFSVELARAACEILNIVCTVQTRRFPTLEDALDRKDGDVIAAAIPIDARLRRRFNVTLPYHRSPARFARRKGGTIFEPAEGLSGAAVGMIAGSAHEAYLAAFFPQAKRRGFPDFQTARDALQKGEIDLLFADAVPLAFWIGGSASESCCLFASGPYLESRYFGEGIGFITRKEDDLLKKALDYALQRLWDDGKYAEIYLKFFPTGIY